MPAVSASPEMDTPVLDIIGPGAIGLHLALALPAHLQVRLRHPDFGQLSRALITDDESRHQRAVALLALADPAPIAQAIITTKSYQVVPALRTLAGNWTAEPEVLLLTNGLGPQDAATSLLPAAANLLAGVTTEGALRTGPLRRRHTGPGVTHLGPWAGQSQPGVLARWLAESTLQTVWLPDSRAIHRIVWRKLIVNCAINPLTAKYGIPNGDLQRPDLKQQWQPLVDEAASVARAEGIALAAAELHDLVAEVITATARNYSSMQQDVMHHRPTEANDILGVLARRAAHHRLAVPHIERLWQRFRSHAG